jgi:phage terminase small subunit
MEPRDDNHELEPVERKDGSMGLPARGYTWEQFAPEHVKSMIHGASSPRVVEAVAKVVRSEVVEQAPWIVEPLYGDSLERYARAEARSRLLTDHILRVSEEEDPSKIPVRLWESASAADNTAAKLATDLGITPLARARIANLTTSTAKLAYGG